MDFVLPVKFTKNILDITIIVLVVPSMTYQVGQWNVTVLWSVRHLTVLLKHSLSFILCPAEPEVTAQAHTQTP